MLSPGWGAPSPWGRLLGEVQKETNNIREEGDELLVEVAEAEERPHGFNTLRGRPFLDGLQFY